jgi:hypothetical protein
MTTAERKKCRHSTCLRSRLLIGYRLRAGGDTGRVLIGMSPLMSKALDPFIQCSNHFAARLDAASALHDKDRVCQQFS